MKNAKAGVVTVIIVFLILIFAGGTVYSLIRRNRAARILTDMAGMPGPSGPAAGGREPAPDGAGGNGGQARNATAIRAEAISLGTVENNVVINGDVIARSQVSIYPNVTGKITELRFRIGDTVSRGQTVAMVDPSRPGELYAQSPVVSTISGTIIQTPLNPGDTVSAQTAVYVVGNLAGLLVETSVPERFSTAIEPGMSAAVSFEAIPGENFPAEIYEVSPVLDPLSRTLRIRLRFVPDFRGRLDSRIRAGMFATVSLVTGSRISVPVIPRSAVINTYGSWIVFVVNDENVAERREITLGLGNEEIIEVSGGLEPGERIVTVGQNFLSDGEPIRVVE
ncbi:MAG: efflux RND transporter periplasmic adaptor subunit [Treponema sp.]|nr:efflux RND transporter periplasmic adaptor subunit [Treponema sp.]